MRILFTADLHLSTANRDHLAQKFREWIATQIPDAIVVAGDLATAGSANVGLECLRRWFPNGPIAVCLGNHDFWVSLPHRKECASLTEVVDRFWSPFAEQFEIVLLDRSPLLLPGVPVVGGYGHYDLGFAVPGLSYGGVSITEDHYLRGAPPVEDAPEWRDVRYLPNFSRLHEIAAQEIARLRLRLGTVQKAVVVLHTPPFEALLGLPPLDAKIHASELPLRAFFRAYLGNRGMGEFLKSCSDQVPAIVCGHTHRAAGPMILNGTGTVGINIGADYHQPEAAVYDVASRQFERVSSS